MQGHVTFLFLLAVLVPLAVAQPLPWQICGDTGNYTANSTYQANLRFLSTALPTNASSSPTLFATATVGTVPEQITALILCRGDMNVSACRACATQAFQDAQQLCPYNKDVAIYYDPCLLRFSNRNFLASTDNDKEILAHNLQNITSSVDRYERLVSKLLNATTDYAAANSTRRFATSEVDFDASFPKIYGLTQCTPDLTPAQCRGCLADSVATLWRTFARNTQGARIFGVRCNLRFEVYSFYNGAPLLQVPAEVPAPAPAPALVPVTPAALGGKKSSVTVIVLAIVLPMVAAILAITAIYFCFWRRRLARKPALPCYYMTFPSKDG